MIDLDNSGTFGNTNSGNYAQFDEKGQIRLYGDATQWDDLRVPITTTRLGGNDPGFAQAFDNGAASRGVFTYYFDATADEEVFFIVQMPHNWKQGSDIKCHAHWFPSANGGVGEKVSWGLEYTWQNFSSVFGNTTIIYGNTSSPDEDLVQDKHYITQIGTITATGKTFSSMLLCRGFRDATGTGATDSYTADAGLLEFDFHYQIDSFGSDEEYVKYD